MELITLGAHSGLALGATLIGFNFSLGFIQFVTYIFPKNIDKILSTFHSFFLYFVSFADFFYLCYVKQ